MVSAGSITVAGLSFVFVLKPSVKALKRIPFSPRTAALVMGGRSSPRTML